MIRLFRLCYSLPVLAFVSILLLIASCTPAKKKVDISQIDVNIRAERFDKDLVSGIDNIALLKKKYGSFFDLFTYRLLEQMGTPDTVLLKNRLTDFINDADIKNIYIDATKVFSDFTPVDKQLTDAFRYYKYYFPHKIIPRAVTFISGFNYAFAPADSVIGIGIDMYLGDTSRYYPSLQLPQFKIRRMRTEYIAADCMKSWIQTDWEQNPNQSDFLSQAIYQGKILYFLDMVMPDTPDSIKTGYTEKQLKWCEENEKNTWSFFVEQKLLFSTDQSQLVKYVNDGPTTNGFPKESPGNIAQWLGWRIVKDYMEHSPQTTLAQLMDMQDYKKIFRESMYKPKK